MIPTLVPARYNEAGGGKPEAYVWWYQNKPPLGL
jgi:hypothetical protein